MTPQTSETNEQFLTAPDAPFETAPTTPKTLGTAPAAKPEKKMSGKNKIKMGIPADHKTCWAPVDFSPADHERITKVAAQIGKPLAQVLVELTKAAIEQHKAEYDALAAQYDKSPKTTGSKSSVPAKSIEDMTAEELAAYMAKTESLVARQQKAAQTAADRLAAAKAAAQKRMAQASGS
jgi:hypothetical protein